MLCDLHLPSHKCSRAPCPLRAPTCSASSAGLLAQGQYDLDPLSPFPDHVQYAHYSDQIGKGCASPRCPQPCHVKTRPQMCLAQLGRGGIGPGVLGLGCGSFATSWWQGISLTSTNPTLLFIFRQPRLLRLPRYRAGARSWGGGALGDPGGGGGSRCPHHPNAELSPRPPEEQFQSQQQVQQEVIPAPTPGRPQVPAPPTLAPCQPWEWVCALG